MKGNRGTPLEDLAGFPVSLKRFSKKALLIRSSIKFGTSCAIIERPHIMWGREKARVVSPRVKEIKKLRDQKL